MEEPAAAARTRFVVWLHGLGDNGRANEPVAGYAFAGARWVFPTAPTAPVTCNRGARMPSWFDIHDTPITSKSVRGEEDVLRAVQSVHAMIDREISAGTSPGDVFVFGLSQGGALSIASVLLYPKTLGGCAVFSGFLPFASSFASRVTPEAKKTPVLWIHGRADFLVPIEAGQDGTKFIRGLGMSCEFKVYDELGHELACHPLTHQAPALHQAPSIAIRCGRAAAQSASWPDPGGFFSNAADGKPDPTGWPADGVLVEFLSPGVQNEQGCRRVCGSVGDQQRVSEWWLKRSSLIWERNTRKKRKERRGGQSW